METKQQIKQYCQKFKITGISTNLEQLVTQAETMATGFLDFTLALLKAEADHRHGNELRKRLKTARLPRSHDLDAYDHTVDNGLPRARLNQLRELNWIDQVTTSCLWAHREPVKRYWLPDFAPMPLKKDTKPTSEPWTNCLICLS